MYRVTVILLAAAAAATLTACGDSSSVETVTVTEAVAASTGAVTSEAPPVTETSADEPDAPTETSVAEPDAPTETTATEAVDRPAGFPNPAERLILDSLRPDIAARCTREDAEDRSPGAIAGLYCNLVPTYGLSVYYERFRTQRAVRANYLAELEESGITPGTGRCLPRKGKPVYPGEGPWNRGEATLGGVFCFQKNNRQWVQMSEEPRLTYVYVNARGRSFATDFLTNRNIGFLQ